MAAPYGLIVQPLENFRKMLSKCTAFQAWCEETDNALPAEDPERSAACLDYIHLIKYSKPSGGYVYPVAIVDLPEDAGRETVAVNANGIDFNNGSGIFDVTFYRIIPEDLRTDDVAAYLDFSGMDDNGTKTGLGVIAEQLGDLSYEGTYLIINQIALQEGPWWLSEEKKAGSTRPLIGAKLRIHWGIG